MAETSILDCSTASVLANERVDLILRGAGDPLKSDCLPSVVRFTTGNPAIEAVWGEVQLCKEEKKVRLPPDRGTIVCIIGVPTQISAGEFCQRIKDYHPHIMQLRIVKDSAAGLYNVIIKFVDQPHADRFYFNFNGKPFNTMEPDIMRIGFVLSSCFAKPGHSLFPPPATDLPDCPVCLEKIESIDNGILISICNHLMHCSCLSQQKWDSDGSCPVCRYCIRPSDDSVCAVCSASQSLWICLICGHIGCGRFVAGHAEEHFAETQHTFALELETQRVWDYAADNYVHRLLQNKADGKLVELQSPENNDKKKAESAVARLKWEYNFLLTTQLEDQRKYFEAKLLQVEEATAKRITNLQQSLVNHRKTCKVQLERTIEKTEKAERTKDDLERELISVRREKQVLESLNRALLEEQKSWRHRLQEIEAANQTKASEISELQDQIRDLSLFIEAGKTLAKEQVSEEELKGSSVVVSPTKPNNSRGGRRRRSKA